MSFSARYMDAFTENLVLGILDLDDIVRLVKEMQATEYNMVVHSLTELFSLGVHVNITSISHR